jgi:hypothetical protein
MEWLGAEPFAFMQGRMMSGWATTVTAITPVLSAFRISYGGDG